MQGIAINKPILVGLGVDNTSSPTTQPNLIHQYIVSPLGVSAISYGAIVSNVAILNSKNEADQHFKEQANLLGSLWKDFKAEFYANKDSVRQDDLDTFYKTLISILPAERQVECARLVADHGYSNFTEMPLDKKLKVSCEIARPRPDSPIDYQEMAFDQLHHNVQEL